MLGREQVERIRAALGLGALDWSGECVGMVELRCGRCSAPLEPARSAGVDVSGEHAYAWSLCATHAEEVRSLLEHYMAHRVSVLPGNRLSLRLTPEAIPAQREEVRPQPLPKEWHGRGASLVASQLVAEPSWFAGLPPEQWVARTKLEQTWTCANRECGAKQHSSQVRHYSRVRGHNALFAICPRCREKLGPDPEIEIDGVLLA